MKDSRNCKTQDYQVGDRFYIFAERNKLEYFTCTLKSIDANINTLKLVYEFRNKSGILKEDSVWVKSLEPFFKDGIPICLTSLRSSKRCDFYDTKIQILTAADKIISSKIKLGSINLIREINLSKLHNPEHWC